MPVPEIEVEITARYDDRASAGIERLRADLEALAGATQVLADAEAGASSAIETVESFRDRYVDAMSGMSAEVRDSLETLIEGGYMALARALTATAASGEFCAQAFGKAMLELSARAVLAIGQQAAVKSVFALAEGLLFKDPSAFAAAKLYGAVAAMALAAGGAMMGAAAGMAAGPSPGAGGSRTYGARGPGYGSVAAGEEEEKPGIVVNVHVQGHVVDSRAFVEEHVAPALAEAVGRGVAAKGEYNLIVERD